MMKFISVLFLFLTSCMTIPEINDKFAEIDRVWLLEYQKHEDLYRSKVIDAPYLNTFSQIKKAMVELGMPVMVADFEKGLIIGQASAPTPLTKEEWLQVREYEQPRVRDIGGWMFYMPEDPKDQIVTVRVSVKPIANKTFILLEYEIDYPEYKRMGIKSGKIAPPSAVKIGSLKFWNKLDNLLQDVKLPKTRNKNPDEIKV